MSYGVRNTLILLIVLVVIAAGAWSYIYFYQSPQIEELESQVDTKRTELQEKQQIANGYPALVEQFEEATDFFNNYPKSLYGSSDEDRVYDFINELNTGLAYTDFSFAFNDSTREDQYGIINMDISGEGYYRNVVNFIRQIELSRPLNKISNIEIQPINEVEEYGRVQFNFTLRSYYDRIKLLEDSGNRITNNLVASVHNPFFPLIRDIKQNTENKIDVENSKLIAVSNNRLFLLDQNGTLQRLREGDEVYLGHLSDINLNERQATFVLNKGGIIERITIKIDSDLTDGN